MKALVRSLVGRSPRGLVLAAAFASAACSESWEATPARGAGSGGGAGSGADPLPTDFPQGLRVSENRLVDRHGTEIILRGVNRSGTEYRCIQGAGIFDGPDTEESVQAMTTWNINAVRVPLNETCWLDINGAPVTNSGEAYQRAIRDYVTLLHRYQLIPILELHWAAPGDERATGQRPMPNADHTAAFWADVAATFNDDSGVILEPYNEPFLYQFGDQQQQVCGEEAWNCWRDGCTILPDDYQAAGMQELVTAIRDTGSTHVILLGGLDWSNCFDGFLSHLPDDPIGNLAASWHVYNFTRCSFPGCWDSHPADVARVMPVIATELGQDNCQGEWVKPYLQWLDDHRMGYLAWQWNSGACVPGDRGASLFLVQDYARALPSSEYAQTVRDHFQAAAR
ncbi:MAG TPA: cellulase family glycosylhydrolase [Polyangiaceae bacterium]